MSTDVPANSPRILVIGPAWVGDMVMAQSLYITLKQFHPDCTIDVVAPAWSLPMLTRMPQVRRGIELQVGHKQLGLSERWRAGRALRHEHYAQAIVLPRSLKAALIPWFASIQCRTGYRGEMRYGLINDMRILDKTRLTQTVQRFVALGHPPEAVQPPNIPEPKLTVDSANQQRLLSQLGLSTDKSIVAMMPGAEYGPAKQWPLASWRALAQRCVTAGKQVWIVGSAKEQAGGAQVAQGITGVHNLCGKTALVDAVDLLAMAQVAVTNDSGLMHVACATGVPVVAIYGSSSPNYTPPLSANAKVIYHALHCSPCFERSCRFGHTNCLTQISEQEVWERMQAIKEVG
jgi:heptosyltransferase II